ncbi:hypothetical protein PR001_g7206 [Phytophthora rubi]|uniref:Uncharacterized protein n=1 Tax=Phytophthora rubi TaxID=129364 RepID=A0A6A3N417_9STRA|nr:hypothetical protein PR001_g7206 [Phytophthora rubi]
MVTGVLSSALSTASAAIVAMSRRDGGGISGVVFDCRRCRRARKLVFSTRSCTASPAARSPEVDA